MTRLSIWGAAALVLGITAPAWADATVFVGANTTPVNRAVKGFAIGMNRTIVGFEFEYASTSEDFTVLAPSLKTGMGNLVLQPPLGVAGFQPYVTAGGGLYREELGAVADTSFGVNAGGGVKIGLVGPLQLRVDYRIFRLGGGALNSPAHRIYAGINVKF